jgi:UDP-glucose 4-epimerase
MRATTQQTHEKQVLVTGGAGFIGSHLTRALLQRGYQLTVLDNLSTGKIENIADLLDKKGSESKSSGRINFIQGSITDLPLLHELFHGMDFIFHQAAIPSVPRSIEDPLAIHEANVTGTLNVLLAARDMNVRKVVFASSSSVYGDTPTLPKVEEMVPNPLSPYAVSKLAGEYYCRVFQQVYGLSTACLRYFNVYGPRQDPNSQYAAVIPLFIQKLYRGEPPIIFGDGEQSRDFTFVKDVAEANILAAESTATGIFNIGRGERSTINRLAELISEQLQVSVEPLHQEPRQGDVKHSLADITRARQFGYAPKYSLLDGLKQTISSTQSRSS